MRTDGTTLVTMPTGHQIRVLDHRAKAHDFGTWEADALRAICGMLEPGMVVYDVGAEEGEFSALYGHIVGPENVHLFEPTPSVWPNIRRAWEANFDALPGGAWYGFAGAGYSVGSVERLAREWPPVCAGPLQPDSRFSVVTERPDIPAITLDEYADLTGESPDVVVIDVEGAEGLVVQGAGGIMAGPIHLRPVFAVSVHPPSFLQRFPCTRYYDNGGRWSSEHLFRMFSDRGYVGRHVHTDHEAHWIFTPTERTV